MIDTAMKGRIIALALTVSGLFAMVAGVVFKLILQSNEVTNTIPQDLLVIFGAIVGVWGVQTYDLLKTKEELIQEIRECRNLEDNTP